MSNQQLESPRRRVWMTRGATALALMVGATIPLVPRVSAATSDGCAGGGFQIVSMPAGTVLTSGVVDQVIPAANFGAGPRFAVRGRYNQFEVALADFAVFNYALTGAPNPEDLTGGRFTPVWASKTPDHRGLSLTSGVTVQSNGPDLVIQRSGAGLTMKIQAKDCATGGIFQMEPQRADGTRTRVVHTLATSPTAGLTPFYFDNPNFRARIGQFLGSDCTSVETGPPGRFCVKVTARVNIANDLSPKFVARDSAQVATRINQTDCNTANPITPSVAHCGGVTVWDIASGGRMGFVTGADSVEVANPPTVCVQDCQAQNQVKGRLVVLGFPFPVPADSRLTPRVSAMPLPALTAP
jgi:hypothetical protein